MAMKGDSFADKHGKTLLTWLVVCIGAYFTLEAKVESVTRDKADRIEVQALKAEVQEGRNEIRNMARDLNTVVQYICQSEARSLGCQRSSRQ
jgi:hypothetical protein